MFDIQNTSIQQIHNSYKNKQLTVRTLVLSYLSRIAKIDKGAQGLNSILEINPDVLFIADELDEKMKSIDEFAPLFGIPVLLKDNINTADKLHTSAGSLALSNNYASYDAHIAKCLRKAGAIILGKANMTEFANFITDGEMPDGYSSRGGQVINPYNRTKTPSGSSSGSAVSVPTETVHKPAATATAEPELEPPGFFALL
jgi:amidase